MTGETSRLIAWHWQRAGDDWFPASWSFAISMDLGFGLIFDSIMYLVFAKQLKQRQINKLADAGGGNVFSVWVFFPVCFQIMSYTGLWIQKE